MVINTPYGNSGPRIDGYEIRSAAVGVNIPCVTTVQGASAAVQGIEAGIRGEIGVRSLQELHSALQQRRPLAMPGFGARLADAVSRRGPLCLGIDPHPELLRAWDLPISPDGLAAFCEICVQAYADFAVVKPQVAFFEAYGAAGYAVLERTIAALARRRCAGAGRRQARRHRVDDGGLRGGLGGGLAAGRRRRDGLALSGFRLAAATAGHRRGARPRGVRVGGDVEPGGCDACSAPRPAAARWPSRSSTRPRRPTARWARARLCRRRGRRDGDRGARCQRARRTGAGARHRRPGRAGPTRCGGWAGPLPGSCCPRCPARCCGPVRT